MIEDFINEISEVLNIDAPKISYDTSKFVTETMLAYYDGETIFVKSKEFTFDLLFAIVHELRHIWQIKYNESFYFHDYKTLNEMEDIVEYNLQRAELDANAFASIIMVDYFQVEPLHQGLPDFVVKEIKKRADEIAAGYISSGTWL